MRSASTTPVSSPSALSLIAQERALKGQPTDSVQAEPVEKNLGTERVVATAVAAPAPAPAPVPATRLPEARVVARPVMGQGPIPIPTPTAPVPAADLTTISLSEANDILVGLQSTLQLADNAVATGWKCASVDDSIFYKGRVLRDRLAQFVLTAKAESRFEISKGDVDAAEKILACSDEATSRKPNTSAYIALGVIVAGAAIYFSAK